MKQQSKQLIALLKHSFMNKISGRGPSLIKGLVKGLVGGAISCFIIISVGWAAQEVRKPRLAVLPFENLSGQFGADEAVMAGLKETLSREFSLVSDERLIKILTDLRVRHTGYLTTEEVKRIGKYLGVKVLLLGMIDTYRPRIVPQVSFWVTLISTDGEAPLIWSRNFFYKGSQYLYLLKREGCTEWSCLIQKVAEEMIKTMPKNIDDKGRRNK